MLSQNQSEQQQFREYLHWMMEQGLVEPDLNEVLGFTQKGREWFKGQFIRMDVSVLPKHELSVVPKTEVDWEQLFIKFIMEAKVPARLEGTRGDVYAANKFSVQGLKVFRKAMESGVNYDVLVKSVMLYYKSSIKLKKAIGNYFIQGDWRTDYDALLSAANDGTISNHIKTQTDDGQQSAWKLG